ncbi:MAG TPA: aldo/keto reductase [Bacteroidales bacterium]|nr:aldo/keto reductase [Bacteroidales bacterium]HQG36967.1 aldo/keto reductase [Bacteroidales bacterium]HQG52203.1 aldo/keto reductase [Bacteroidales bacterium]HQJ19989.1 aldo/keto reductase [Bacteroidales bacterium]HRC89096.1 aldo/keto reductase [Bacteroidales bacterium]
MKKARLTRRKFVAVAAAGAGSLIIGKKAIASATVDISGAGIDPFKTVTLGNTGIKTTLLGMGTGFNGYNRTSSITRAGVAESVIRYAYEKGIRYFDCADSYGTHTYVRDALKSYPRESYVIGTKMWVTRGGIPEPERPDAEIVIDRFRKELNTDYIDLVQLHCMTSGSWNDEQKRFLDGLEKLKAKNIIRAHGVSIHSLDAMKTASESQWVDTVHVRINPYGESMDSRDPSDVVTFIKKLHDSGKGVIAMKLIGNGSFKDDSEKINESLKYVLSLGTVNIIIVGFEKPEQIDDYINRMKKTVI